MAIPTQKLARSRFAVLACLAAMLLGGCSGGLAGGLRSAGVGSTPDEFMVLPTKPLEMPQNLASLPPPTPGRPNLVDYRPRTEVIAGLTGRPGPRGTANAPAVVARAGPIDPQIRTTLAVENVEYRRNNRGLLLERLFSRDDEALIYRDMTLDTAAEYQRLRASGVQVPPAPPDIIENGVRRAPPRSDRPELRGWRVPASSS